MQNIDALREKLQNQIAYLIENPLNMRYLTGCGIDTGGLLLCGDAAYFITDFRYIEVAENYFKGTDVGVVQQNKIREDIAQLLQKHNMRGLDLETSYQTVDRVSYYRKSIENILTDGSLDKAIYELRCVKQPEEIEKIKAAQAITDAAFTHILKYIQPGVAERDIALEIEFFMRKNGAQGVSFDLICVSGKHSSLPHGVPSDKKIENGDFVTMDTGCIVDGYCSDMTRTVAVGFATDRMKAVYDTVLDAQSAALQKIRQGIRAREVDKAARDVIDSAGYAGCFGHATGHGVGLYIHEEPRLSAVSDTILQENMVVTVEPGIYLKNQFGVRTEDLVVVKKDGCENLTQSPKELLIL